MFPLFCALLFGTIDYGWYFYQRFALATAVRDGVRLGVTVRPSASSPNDPATLAIQRATDVLKVSAGMATVPVGTFTASQGVTSGSAPLKTLLLQGSLAFSPLVNFVKLPTAPMKYSMTMMFEQQD